MLHVLLWLLFQRGEVYTHKLHNTGNMSTWAFSALSGKVVLFLVTCSPSHHSSCSKEEEASMMDHRSPVTYCVIYQATATIPLTGASPYVNVGSCTTPMHQRDMLEYEARSFLRLASSQICTYVKSVPLFVFMLIYFIGEHPGRCSDACTSIKQSHHAKTGDGWNQQKVMGPLKEAEKQKQNQNSCIWGPCKCLWFFFIHKEKLSVAELWILPFSQQSTSQI